MFEIISAATRIKIAEKKCRSLRDHLYLIQGTCLAPIQREKEILSFLAEASKLPIESALEIGTANGGTFYLLCKVAKRDATLLTIDLENDWRRVALFRSYSKLAQNVQIIRGRSQDEKTLRRVVRALDSRNLDVLFIDGDHSFAGVSKDFELYSKLVRPGGLVVMHDIIPDYQTRYGILTSNHAGDVPRFWNSIKSKWKTQEFVESYDQDAYGIGLIHWNSETVNQNVKTQQPTRDVPARH